MAIRRLSYIIILATGQEQGAVDECRDCSPQKRAQMTK